MIINSNVNNTPIIAAIFKFLSKHGLAAIKGNIIKSIAGAKVI